jgi:hypothetical protein
MAIGAAITGCPGTDSSRPLTRRPWFLCALAGAAAFGAGVFLAPALAGAALLLWSFFVLTLALAGLFFIAVLYVSGAGWAVALRRVPEALAGLVPVGVGGVLLALVCCPDLYPWAGAHAEPLPGFKGFWLDRPFFLARALVYGAAWWYFARAIVRNSRAQDFDGDILHTQRNVRLSAAFLVVFALTFWLASVDWLMSLEPYWFSTIFGVYHFSGLLSGGMAALILITVRLRARHGLERVITADQLHDLGKLLLAFCTVWAYMWFCQYMLIWYANIPEETSHYVVRLQGAWGPLFLASLVLGWVAPFLMLLPRESKRRPERLSKVAVIVLAAHVLNLYLAIHPAVSPDTPYPNALDLIVGAGMIALAAAAFRRRLGQAALIPQRDPYLYESISYHQ